MLCNGSLARSVQWLPPYLRGDKTHVEFVASDVAFDQAARATAKQAM